MVALGVAALVLESAPHACAHNHVIVLYEPLQETEKETEENQAGGLKRFMPLEPGRRKVREEKRL